MFISCIIVVNFSVFAIRSIDKNYRKSKFIHLNIFKKSYNYLESQDVKRCVKQIMENAKIMENAIDNNRIKKSNDRYNI